jgi:hypothetical protein
VERSLPGLSFLGMFFFSAQEKHFQEGKGEPQISPLRCAPVEMTKGGAVIARGSGQRDRRTADLSTALRSGRDDKGEDRFSSGQGTGEPQISPPRCAPVEMTKGRAVIAPWQPSRKGRTADLSTAVRSGRDDKRRAVLPGGVVAEREPFSSPWVGPPAQTSLAPGLTRVTGNTSRKSSC